MPRFTDNWVVDKSMFDYVQGGSCACCGFPHLFAPGGLEGLIHAMSDLETDAATKEINAAKTSPWPPDMRDQIWSDRLLLRYKMKKEMARYRALLEGVVKDAAAAQNAASNGDGAGIVETDSENENRKINIKDAIPILHNFCTHILTPYQLRQIFQLPRSELTDILKSKYKMCSAYAVVFCSVVEQVANFKVTGYDVDARCGSSKSINNDEVDNAEELFENDLRFEKVGPGFCLNIVTGVRGSFTNSGSKYNNDNDVFNNSNAERVNEEVLLRFLRRMVSLAGPTLLARAAKALPSNYGSDDSDNENSGDFHENERTSSVKSNVPSFRSDRRVVRLLIVFACVCVCLCVAGCMS